MTDKILVIIPAGFFGSKTVGDSRNRVTEREPFLLGGWPHITYYGRDIPIERTSSTYYRPIAGIGDSEK